MPRPGLIGALIFVALGCAVLPYPGIQTDEAMFGSALYHISGIHERFRAFGHDVPTMLMTYIGALKTWLYAPIFRLWAPSAWSIRLPMVLLGAATIALFARLLDEVHGRRAAWIGTLLLATDTSLVMTTTFDWGPVALQHFLFTASAYLFWRFHRTERAWCLALAAFLCGLALWNKAVFSWTLIGCGLALLLVFPRRIWQLCAIRHLLLAAFFFAGGASMLIRYNVRSGGGTWAATARFAWSNISDKYIHVLAMLKGNSVFGYIVREDNYLEIRWSLLPYVAASAVILVVLARQRAGLFAGLAAVLTWLAMTTTKDGGSSIHHAILLYPLLHWVMAAGFSLSGLHRFRHAIIAIALLLALDNVRLVWHHRLNGQRLGGSDVWSDAIFPLADHVRALNPAAIRMYDWGLQDNLMLLAQHRRPVLYPPRPFDERAFVEFPNAVWIGPVEERIPGIQKELALAAARHGYEKVLRQRFRDRHGRPSMELFEFRKATR